MLNKLIKTPGRADLIQVSKAIKVRTEYKTLRDYIKFCGQKIYCGEFVRVSNRANMPDFIDYNFYFGEMLLFAECIQINGADHVKLYKGVNV